MNLLAEAWKQYAAKIYPQGMSKVQETECQQAFMSGAQIGIEFVIGVCNVESDVDPCSVIDQARMEIEDYHQHRLQQIRGRN